MHVHPDPSLLSKQSAAVSLNSLSTAPQKLRTLFMTHDKDPVPWSSREHEPEQPRGCSIPQT